MAITNSWLALSLLVHIFVFDSALCNVEIGIMSSGRMDADVIVAFDASLKLCGRVCLYQGQCASINYNSDTSMCELLKSGGYVESSQGFNHSDIKTWKMTNDVCHPNPCSDMHYCRKNCRKTWLNEEYVCKTIETHCNHSECQNGATCVNGLTSYTCRCPEGYNGDFCENEIINENFYPFGIEAGDFCTTGVPEHWQSDFIPVTGGIHVPYLGLIMQGMRVHSDGYIVFNNGYVNLFYADLDYPTAESVICYRDSNTSTLNHISTEFENTFKVSSVELTFALITTYKKDASKKDGTLKNTMQCVLATNGTSTYAILVYEEITFEGDRSLSIFSD